MMAAMQNVVALCFSLYAEKYKLIPKIYLRDPKALVTFIYMI